MVSPPPLFRANTSTDTNDLPGHILWIYGICSIVVDDETVLIPISESRKYPEIKGITLSGGTITYAKEGTVRASERTNMYLLFLVQKPAEAH